MKERKKVMPRSPNDDVDRRNARETVLDSAIKFWRLQINLVQARTQLSCSIRTRCVFAPLWNHMRLSASELSAVPE